MGTMVASRPGDIDGILVTQPTAEERLALRRELIAALALTDLRPIEQIEHAPEVTTVHLGDELGGRYFASDRQGNVTARALPGGEELFRLPGAGHQLGLMRSGPGGRLLAGKRNGTEPLRVWDIEARQILFDTREPVSQSAFDFHPGGERLAVATTDGAVDLLELPSGEKTLSFAARRGLQWLRFDSTGRRLALVAVETADVVDATSGTVFKTLVDAEGLMHVAWHPQREILALATSGGKVHLWDVETGDRTLAVEAHVTASFAGFAGTDFLLSACWDRTVRLRDLRLGAPVLTVAGNNPAMAADGSRLAVITGRTRIELYEILKPLVCRSLRGPSRFLGMEVDASGKFLYTAHDDGVRLSDLATGAELARVPGVKAGAALSPAGDLLASAGVKGLDLWPVARERRAPGLLRLKIGPPRRIGQGQDLAYPCFARGGRLLSASEPWKYQARLFDLAGEPGRGKVVGMHPATNHASPSPDGRWLGIGSWGANDATVWDTATGELAVKFMASGSANVVFSPRGDLLAISSSQAVEIAAAGSWELKRRIQQETARTNPAPVAFSPDGAMLALSVKVGAIRLVDPYTAEELVTLLQPTQALLSYLAFARDGGLLVAATRDWRLMVWDLRRVRGELGAMGLDWDQPSLPALDPGDETMRVEVTVEPGSSASPAAGVTVASPASDAALPPGTRKPGAGVMTGPPDPGAGTERVPLHAEWRFFVGRKEPSAGVDWAGQSFDDRSWQTGRSCFGFGRREVLTVLPDMLGRATTLYLRHRFQVGDLDRVAGLELRVLVEGGFVAYLNGSEVARSRAGPRGTGLAVTAIAERVPAESAGTVEVRLDPGLLNARDSVLAVLALSHGLDSVQFRVTPALVARAR
jgi:WD40 repeat protein